MIKRKTKSTEINKTNCYYSVSTSSSLNFCRKEENKIIPQMLTTCRRLLHQVLNVCVQLLVVDFQVDQPLWTKERYKRISPMSIKNSLMSYDLT